MPNKITALLLFLSLAFVAAPAGAQTRLSDRNTIGWFNIFGTYHLGKKITLNGEYQWRRDGLVKDWQQSLARGSVQYNFNKDVSAAVGYGYIITFPYGDYPAGPYSFPEHRIFEQLVWNDHRGRISLNHRLRLEQRFLGQIDQKAAEKEVQRYNYLNRLRYQIRAQAPLSKRTMGDNTWYAAAYDEIFIGFGPNVNQNIFDQNRIGLLLGYQLNKTFKLEAGYLNQTVQQGGEIQGKEVYQYNNGLIVNFYVTGKWSNKSKVEGQK